MAISTAFKFAADSTLGKLAKWLRLLGFDTTFETNDSDEVFTDHAENGRVVITRSKNIRKQLGDHKFIFIASNNPGMQLKQVLAEIGIHRSVLQPFSRCIQCNIEIVDVGPDEVYGLIPDYIYESHNKFQKCPQCSRIFWRGSHTKRALEKIDNLFEK
jgi:hypothetical protein